MKYRRALPDITSGPEVRKSYKIRTVWKPCFLVIFDLPTYLVLLYNVPFFGLSWIPLPTLISDVIDGRSRWRRSFLDGLKSLHLADSFRRMLPHCGVAAVARRWRRTAAAFFAAADGNYFANFCRALPKW